jgi:hypothetical protein
MYVCMMYVLNPLDFLLWGYAKNICQMKNNNLQQLKTCVRTSVAAVTHNMLQNTWTEVEYLLCHQACPSWAVVREKDCECSFASVQTRHPYNEQILRYKLFILDAYHPYIV